MDGEEVKRQAQAGQMGEQLYTVVYKRRTWTITKTGKKREKWVRGYRAPRPEDDVSDLIAERLAEKLPEWEALDLIPTEAIGEPSNYDRGASDVRDVPLARSILTKAGTLSRGWS